jgi:hypothetical protein
MLLLLLMLMASVQIHKMSSVDVGARYGGGSGGGTGEAAVIIDIPHDWLGLRRNRHNWD